MRLDARQCTRAYLARDRRFDGRFFLGVRTTGVYCRPICPAPSPKPANVRFFACAAAAEAAGFRACRRCRPDTAPGTPGWSGTSATVSRALRLIALGALDEGGMEDLAARLGVGGRHLRRLFDRHLGASPRAVARTRRAHFARALIDGSNLPMNRIAFHAGFGSVRQFNDAIRTAYGAPPRELRRASRGTPVRGEPPRIAIRLPYVEPFSWKSMLSFFSPRATPGVEQVAGASYARTIRWGKGVGVLRVGSLPEEPALLLEVELEGGDDLLGLVDRVRRLFDLGADPRRIAAGFGSDRALARVIRRGLRVPGAWDPFELTIRAILGQQVSVAAATTLAGRLVARFGEPTPNPELPRLFPTPKALAAADVGSIGLPRSRARSIVEVASRVADGALRFEAPDLEGFVSQMISVPGVGEWTAHYVAMRALGEPDAFPASDLGLRKAMAGGEGLLSAGELLRRAEAWRPWRAYAAIALWSGAISVHDVSRRSAA